MKISFAKALPWMSLLGLCLLAAPVWATTTVLLDANFNDKPLDTQIGTGGPLLGEPVQIDIDLEAKVQAGPLTTPSLHVKRSTVGSSVFGLFFEFPDGAELQYGEARISYTVRAPAVLTQFNVGIREQGTNADTFGNLTFTFTGYMHYGDESGSVLFFRSYTPNETLNVEYRYHLNAGTYDLLINDTPIFENRPHGVTDPAEGIGRVFFSTNGIEAWVVDDILVTHTTPGTLLLDANFNDKPLDAPIETGGPTLGEPIDLSAGLNAIVRAAPFASPSLHLSQASGGSTRSARFEFLGGEEVKRGQARIGFTIRTPPMLDSFQVRLRESTSSSATFGGVTFTAAGELKTNDSPSATTIGTYLPNQTLHFELVHQLVAGTYDMYIDGALVLDDRVHSVTSPDKGIGAVLVGLTGTSTQEWVVDELRAERDLPLLDANFNDQILDQQIGTRGAAAGQPVAFSSVDLIAEPRSGSFVTPSLALAHPISGTAKSARFELIDSAEITRGELRISLRVLPSLIDDDEFNVFVREQGTSVEKFGSLQFRAGGIVSTTDTAGSLTVGTFAPGIARNFEFRYHFDSGTYDIYIDRMAAVTNRPWGMTTPGRGIGALLVGTHSTTQGQWVVDDLYVYQPADTLYANGFD